MSVSAATAAKRRRAGNIVSTPLFKPTSAPLENTVQRRTNLHQSGSRQQIPPQQPQQRTPMPETVDSQPNMQRPMSLQQVISVFDKRLLHIEGHIIKTGSENSQHNKVDSSSITKDMDTLKESIRENLDGQFSEFDHRYQLLANEISNLKQIVLKLQSYSLEINKSLMDERNEILSKLDNVQEKVEETIDASTNTLEEENIIFDVSSSDVKQEFIENACDDMEEEVVEKQSDQSKNPENIMKELVDQVVEQNAEPKEDDIVEEQNAEPKEDDIVEEQNAEPKEDDIVEEQNAEHKEDDIVEEQNTEHNEDDIMEEDQVARPTEDEEVVEEQVTDQENSKQKKKRKNKNVVAISV